MKRYIVSFLLSMIMQKNFAQMINENDSVNYKIEKSELKTVVVRSNYIVEVVGLRPSDYYYIPEDNQTYTRTFMKISRVIKGSDITVGDTIISVWKQHGKGKGLYEIHVNDGEPTLCLARNSTSCLFLADSKFPAESIPDEWSRFKHTNYIPTSIGYFAACYDVYVGDIPDKIGVFINKGLMFSSRWNWYQYLRQYPDLKVPEGY